MITPRIDFRPREAVALAIDRLAAESGHSAPAILRHVGDHPQRQAMLRLCCILLTGDWRQADDEEARQADRRLAAEQWIVWRDRLLVGIGVEGQEDVLRIYD